VAKNVLIDGVITAISLTTIKTGTAVVYKDGVMVDDDIAVTGTVTSRSVFNLILRLNTTELRKPVAKDYPITYRVLMWCMNSANRNVCDADGKLLT